MSFVVAYALAGAGTLLVVLWVMLYLRYSSQYDVMIAAIDKKQFFLPEIFFIGFGFMDMFKVNLKTEAGRKKEKKIAEIYGEKYAEYYHNCIVGGQITYALTVAPLGLFIGAMTNDMTFAILVVAAAAALIVYLDMEVSSAVERKHDEILSDYPEILSKLTLLVNAGMVIREAWTKVAYTCDRAMYIIDVIDTEDSFIIIMDYVQGNSLNKALEEYGAQPQEYVIEWAKQLCDVLGYLHSRQPPIIYRDMKPANIMLKPDGNVTLIDFGTAREFKEKNLADTTCLGTVGYAAPEQFGGMGQTDARTDIYCLGATLYHLVTGCNPSEPPYEMKPIREINPSLSGGLERIILKCTQRNPEDRYQSAAELMYALDHYKEIDEDYKKKQKRKLAKFIVPTALAVVFAVAGFALSHVAAQQATDTYRDILYEASKTADYGEKVALYGEAIAVPDKAGEKDAYLALIQTYKDNDSRFSVEEANQLTKYIKSNKAALQADPANYTEICFETGKLYWYYYDYGDGTDNQVTRAKSAVEWFQDVLDNAPEGYANLNMARVYVNIGSFYRDITTDITEASDKGKYKPFFDNIRELLDTVATDENESEIVRLELLELSRSALQQYATKFKGDGISQADMMQMYDQVERTVTGISATADTTEHKKEATVSLLADTKKAIETAYATKGGEQA